MQKFSRQSKLKRFQTFIKEGLESFFHIISNFPSFGILGSKIIKMFFKVFLLSFLLLSSNAVFAAEFKIKDTTFYSNQSRVLPRQVDRYTDYYILIDEDSGEVLLEKNADIAIVPSSMTKIMTAYVVFDQIEKGNINLDNMCFVSKEAWRGPRLVPGAAKMFLKYGDMVTVDELIKGLLVASGNDAAIALAESVAGNLELFVSLMNFKAAELGLKNSHFMNPHGLNERGHYMSVRDLAILSRRIRQDFPQYMGYFMLSAMDYNNVGQSNHNPLIRRNYAGATGMKTGYTSAGGYGIVGSATRNNRNLIAVINRARSSADRQKAIFNILDYGFNQYDKINLFRRNEFVATLDLLLSDKKKIKLVTKESVSFNLPRNREASNVKVFVQYKEPIHVPIKQGDKIADLIVEIEDYRTFRFDLYADEDANEASKMKRIIQMIGYKLKSFTKDVLKP